MTKVVDSVWFSTRLGHFGFVIGEDETTKKRKLYAGVVIGLDQSNDEQELLDWGSGVNLDILEGFLKRLNNQKKGGKQ